jgi:hypothetical protein
MAGPLHAERVGDAIGEPFQRQLPVAGLGASVRRSSPNDRPQSGLDQGPLPGTEGPGPGDVEPDVHGRIGGVGVLTSGAAGAADPDLYLA